MYFPAEPKELARQMVAEWAQSSERGHDPFQRLASILREGARYHEGFEQKEAARIHTFFAELLDGVIEEFRKLELDYDQAAELSEYARGTIKNKKREGEGGRGKVRMDTLPLAPLRYPGVRAVRMVDLMRQEAAITEAEERHKAAEDETDEEWATQALTRKTA